MPRPVAVIQLALPGGSTAVRCYLLHIACSGITHSLSRILCSPVRPSSPSSEISAFTLVYAHSTALLIMHAERFAFPM